MNSKVSLRQRMAVIIAGTSIIVISVSTTLYVSFREGDLWGDGGVQKYRNITFTDATLTCEAETKKTYGNKIHQLVVDNHSSRFDESQFVYKIFFKLYLTNEKDKNGQYGTVSNYVNCFVRASNGRISKYEVFEDDDQEGKGLKKDNTNLFGWPR